MKDYYYILGISEQASLDEVKTAYRKLSKKLHPDVNGNDAFFTQQFQAVAAAYEVLSDETARRRYDANRAGGPAPQSAAFYAEQGEQLKKARENLARDQEKLRQERAQFGQSKAAGAPPIAPPARPVAASRTPSASSTPSAFNWRMIWVLFWLVAGLSAVLYRSQQPSHAVLSPPTPEVVTPAPPAVPVAPTHEEKTPRAGAKHTTSTWLTGRWRGTATQFDINERWTMEITGNNAGSGYRIRYPSLGCGGELNLLSATGGRCEFRETITAGDCVPGVRVVIQKVSRRTATYEAYWPDDAHLNAKGLVHLQ